MIKASTPLPFPRQTKTYGQAIAESVIRSKEPLGDIRQVGVPPNQVWVRRTYPIGDLTVFDHETGTDSLPTEDYLNIVAELRILGRL